MNTTRLFGLLLVALMTARAHAHAFLDRAEPRVGSTVSAAPTQLKLWFAQEIEPAFSTVKVVDAKGRRVDKSDAQVDPAHRELVLISVATLGPGDYTVVWRVVATDTHVTQGDFVFHVGP